MKVTFEGYSDDTFGAYWRTGDVDHDDSAAGTTRVMLVKAEGGELLVTGVYAPGSVAATWAVGIAPADEDAPIPDWPMAWEFSGYTAKLILDLPEDFEITLKNPKA